METCALKNPGTTTQKNNITPCGFKISVSVVNHALAQSQLTHR
jgi:hypothetical protein